jgi:predicted ester cyclase
MTLGDQYRELARRLFVHADDTAIDELFAADYEGEYAGGVVRGRDAFRASVGALRSALTPLTYTVHHTAEGDGLLWAHWTASGVHSGHLFDLAPTQRPIAITGLTLNRFVDGKIVWGLVKWDRMALLEQLRAQ